MNERFAQALHAMEETGEHLFITGRAGVGKSTLLDYFRATTGKQPVILAPTGIAALLLADQQPQTGLGGFMQGAESPGAMALWQPPAAPNGAMAPPIDPMSNAGVPVTAPNALPANFQDIAQPAISATPATPATHPSTLRNILGAIFDGMAVAGGKEPLYYNTQQKAAQDANTNASALQKMLGEYALARAAHQSDRTFDNANPTTPESVIGAGIVGSASPQQQAIYSKGYNITNPLVATGPNGSTYIPRETIAAGMAGQPIGGGAIPPVTGATYGSGTPMGGTFTDPGSGRSFRRVAPGDTPQSWQEVGGAAPGPQTFP